MAQEATRGAGAATQPRQVRANHRCLLGRWYHRLQGAGVGARLVRGGIGSFSVKVVAAGLAFLAQVLLARVLGAASYGDYVYALTWGNILGLFGRAGMDTAAIRFVSTYASQSQWGLLRGFQRASVAVVLVASLAVAAALAVAALLLVPPRHPALLTVFLVVCVLLPVNSLLSLLAATLQGLKHIVWSQAPAGVVRPLLFAAMLLAFFLYNGDTLGAPAAAALNLAAAALVLTWSFVLAARKNPASVRLSAPEYRSKAWIATILPYMLLSGTHVIMAQTDVVMIGYFLGTQQSGIYSAAAQTATLISFSLIAVNAIAAPMIAELHALNKKPELQRIISLAARGNLLFALPAALLLIAMGKPVLNLFGPEFPTAHVALSILAVGQLVNALAGSVGFLMTMTGHHWQTVLVLSLSALLNVVLNLLLIPPFGLAGAASASALSLAMWNILLTLRVKVLLHIRPTIFATLTSPKHRNEKT